MITGLPPSPPLPSHFVRLRWQFSSVHFFSKVERVAVRVQCLTQHHNMIQQSNRLITQKNHYTYPKSSLISFFDASKGTFRTRIFELVCFLVEADLRCATISLEKKKIIVIPIYRRMEVGAWPSNFCVEILLLCVTSNCISISYLAIHIRLPLVLTFALRFVQNNRATNTTNQPELYVTRSEPFFRGL